MRIWIRPSILIAAGVLAILPLLCAWGEAAFFGLPYIPPVSPAHEAWSSGPHGFPLWVRYAHFFNFLFLMMLVRSGLSILMDHPRLYFNNDCTPGSEWIRFTPLKVPVDRVWTAKDDARYISPLLALPGYRHTVGVARSWHFIDVYGFVITGLVFVTLLFTTGQWQRLVPTSWIVLSQAWSTFVLYANFHLPPEPNGFYGYNALQQLAYFAIVFICGPLSILTGMAMSPAFLNRFPPFSRPFGGRQGARSIHFLLLLSYVAFLIVHVTLVAYDRFCEKYESHRAGDGRSAPVRHDLGLCWHCGSRSVMDSRALHLMEVPARVAARAEGDVSADTSGDAESFISE